MIAPWAEPLVPLEPSARVVPEPARRGEAGGPECGLCAGCSTSPVWSDEHWTLHPPVGGSLPGTVWLASREHVDSFADLSPDVAAAFGPICARVESAVLGRGDVGRVHLYRWGDGGAHFHVWFMPRPLGMLEASGMMLPLWEDVLPNVTDEELLEAAHDVASRMDGKMDSRHRGSGTDLHRGHAAAPQMLVVASHADKPRFSARQGVHHRSMARDP